MRLVAVLLMPAAALVLALAVPLASSVSLESLDKYEHALRAARQEWKAPLRPSLREIDVHAGHSISAQHPSAVTNSHFGNALPDLRREDIRKQSPPRVSVLSPSFTQLTTLENNAGLLAIGADGTLYSSIPTTASERPTVAKLQALRPAAITQDKMRVFLGSEANSSTWFAFGGKPASPPSAPGADAVQPAAWATNSGARVLTKSSLNGLPAYIGADDFATLRMHPTQPNWLLILINDMQNGESSSISRSLYVSLDLGETWTVKRARVTSASWCHAGTHLTNPQTGVSITVSERRVCCVADLDTNEADGGGPARFLISDLFAESYSITVPLPFSASHVVYHPMYTFVVGSPDGSFESTGLYVSGDGGHSFARAEVSGNRPIPYFKPEQLLDDRNGVIWIGIDHDDLSYSYGQQRAGSVYVSDSTGTKFTLVLEDVSVYNNWWDVEPISSVEGAVIANVLVDWNGVPAIQAPGSQECFDTYPVRTLISWNEGRDWSRLMAPNSHSTQQSSLNLFGKTTWLSGATGRHYGDVEAPGEAVGLIVASGNVGRTLDDSPSDVNTYMSRDGGVTWVKIHRGSLVYEFGDRGGVMAAVPNFANSTVLEYSLNQGVLSWDSVLLGIHICVVQVFSVDGAGLEVVVRGYENGCDTTNPMKYIAVDFSEVVTRVCTSADYEEWTLSTNGIGTQGCPLGHQTTFQRRVSTSICRQDRSFIHHAKIAPCPCTPDDYECDVGFAATKNASLTCLAFDSAAIQVIADPCSTVQAPEGGAVFAVTQGYRKLPLDTCVGGLPQYEPREVQCFPGGKTSHKKSDGSDAPHGMAAAAIAAIVMTMVVVIASIIAVVVIGRKKGWFRRSVKASFQPLNQDSEDDGDAQQSDGRLSPLDE